MLSLIELGVYIALAGFTFWGLGYFTAFKNKTCGNVIVRGALSSIFPLLFLSLGIGLFWQELTEGLSDSKPPERL